MSNPMPSDDRSGEMRVASVEAAMKAVASAARFRLMNGTPPQPRAKPPRPVSPFMREVLERRAAVAKAEVEYRAWRAKARQNRENVGPHWSQIVHQVAKKHGLKPRDILKPSRLKINVLARNEAFYRMRTEILIAGVPMSFPAIGRRFGGMDHTSVLHGYRKHAAIVGVDNSDGCGKKRLVLHEQKYVALSETAHSISEAVL